MQGETAASTSEASETPVNVLIVEEFEGWANVVLNLKRNATIRMESVKSGLTAAVAVAEREPPDIIILDIFNPEFFLSDEDCCRFRSSPILQDIPVLFIGMVKSPRYLERQARRFGADGYTSSILDLEEFLAAFDAVLDGETYPPSYEKP